MSIQTRTDDGEVYVSCHMLAQGDYDGASYCEANIRSLEGTKGAFLEHGPYDWRKLWLPDTEENRELCRQLSEDYPIVDEEMMSAVESEWEQEAWGSYGISDLTMHYRRGWKDRYRREYAPRPMMEEAIGLLSNETLTTIYYECMSEGSYEVGHESSGVSLPLEEIAEDYAGRVIRHLLEEYEPDGYTDAAIAEHLELLEVSAMFDLSDSVTRKAAADWCEGNGMGEFAPFLRSYEGEWATADAGPVEG